MHNSTQRPWMRQRAWPLLCVSINRKRLVGQNMRNPNDIVDEFESLSPNGATMNADRCDKNDFYWIQSKWKCIRRFVLNVFCPISPNWWKLCACEWALPCMQFRIFARERKTDKTQSTAMRCVTTIMKLSNSPSPSKPDRAAPMRDGKRVRYKFIASYVPTADATYFYFLQ